MILRYTIISSPEGSQYRHCTVLQNEDDATPLHVALGAALSGFSGAQSGKKSIEIIAKEHISFVLCVFKNA